jgi:hypothetical protein
LNADHVGGILTMAKHQALVFGISWASVVNDARIALDDGLGALLGSVSGSLLERDTLLPKGDWREAAQRQRCTDGSH